MESLIYFALWAGLIFLFMRFGCGAHIMGHSDANGKDASQHPDAAHWVPPKTDIDPVCGKTVRTENAKPTVHNGMVYYLCSRECRERFEAAPDLYVGPKAIDRSKEGDHVHG